ncbi:MAG TPA: hypothetical protein PK286_03780 [Devosia sp.]|nr:hypothetical protein [Devosia sp.]
MRPVHYLLAVCAVASVAIVGTSLAARNQSNTAVAAPPAVTASASDLGDLSAMKTIVTDTAALVTAGNAVGAKARITDFETAWDNAQPELRAKNGQQWDAVDGVADQALNAVRKDAPQPETLAALAGLASQLDHPGTASSGVAIDTSGKPLPCEDMLRQVREAKTAATLDAAATTEVTGLEAKGVERCNADDDKRADAFFADALKLMGK